MLGCGTATGVELQTKATNPDLAAEDVLGQISQQTGLHLSYALDSSLQAIRPAAVVQACSESAVITAVLTPTGPDRYRLSCAYEIDARSPGSIDGTPAGVEAMKKEKAQIEAFFNADSTATRLPAEIAEADLKKIPPLTYFRSPVQISIQLHGQWKQALLLMLHQQQRYTVGFYLAENGVWKIVDHPVELSGVQSSYLTNVPNSNAGAVCFVPASGGHIFVYLDDGKLIRSGP